jgi:hypothetical protein
MVSLGFLAATTARLMLGVSALFVPQRNPLVVLKQLTTLDIFVEGSGADRGGRRLARGRVRHTQGLLPGAGKDHGCLAGARRRLFRSDARACTSRRPPSGGGRVARARPPGSPGDLGCRRFERDSQKATFTGVWHPVPLRVDACEEWLRRLEIADRMGGSCCEST